MFPAKLSEVTAADIYNVLDTEATESIDFELKKGLPSDSGADPWMTGGKFGDRAKDELANEIVAFANTSGGTMIIGISEDPQTKSAKKPIYPIPNCKQAAAILHQALSAKIEPRLPVFECEGVITEQDGNSGVIVMRVLESYLSPHRNTKNNHCYVRRNDRAEPMSMFEIQDLTRRVARIGEVIENAFVKSSERFFGWLPEPHRRMHPYRGFMGVHERVNDKPQYRGGWAVRLTAGPLRPLLLGKLPKQEWLKHLKIEAFSGGGRQGQLSPYDVEVERPWLPRLRAVEKEFRGDWLTGVDRVGSDGQVERFVRVGTTVEGIRPTFLHLGVSQFIWHVASVMRIVDVVRAHADRPTQDFAFEIELMNSDSMCLDGYSGIVPPGLQRLPPGTVMFPRYEIGGQESFNELLTTVDSDLWNAAGNHLDWQLEINWPPARATKQS